MSTRTQHPPSTNDDAPGNPSPRGRRAVLGGIAGVALLVGPVVLANAIVPDEGGTDQVEATASPSLVALRRDTATVDSARANSLLSIRTTTTTAPPTTTTTAPPTTTTTEPPVAEEPAAPSTGGGFGDPGDYATWDALADCESGGNWATNTGNGYYGGLQFSLSTWQAVGGTGLPSDHSRETQIHFGQILQARSGWGQWPHCSSQLGLR